MTTIAVGQDGKVALPEVVMDRYGVHPETPIRLIETPHGILLVPLTEGPMSEELASELEQWQALTVQAWDMFPYEDER